MGERGVYSAQRAATGDNIFIARPKAAVERTRPDNEDWLRYGTDRRQSMLQKGPAVQRQRSLVCSHAGTLAAGQDKAGNLVRRHSSYFSRKRNALVDFQPDDPAGT